MKTYNIDECAAFLKVNPSTAQEMAAAGRIPGAKIGRAWVFMEDDLVAFLRGRIEQQTALRQKSNDAHQSLVNKDSDILSTFPAIRRPKKKRLSAPMILESVAA